MNEPKDPEAAETVQTTEPEAVASVAICSADIEAAAIAGVAAALNPLDSKARLRVITWALDFNHDAAQKQAIETLKRLDILREEASRIKKQNVKSGGTRP